MKIAFVYQLGASNASALERKLAYMRSLGTDITGLNVGPLLGYKFGVSDLDFQYCLCTPQVIESLARLREASQGFQVIVIYGTLQIPSDFIRQAWGDRFVIYWATDDSGTSQVYRHQLSRDAVVAQAYVARCQKGVRPLSEDLFARLVALAPLRLRRDKEGRVPYRVAHGRR